MSMGMVRQKSECEEWEMNGKRKWEGPVVAGEGRGKEDRMGGTF